MEPGRDGVELWEYIRPGGGGMDVRYGDGFDDATNFNRKTISTLNFHGESTVEQERQSAEKVPGTSI